MFVTCDLGALFSKPASTRPPTARKGIGAGRLMPPSPPVPITICGPELGANRGARCQQQHPLAKPASAWLHFGLPGFLRPRRGSCCGVADGAVFCLGRIQLTVPPADILDDRVAAGHHASDVQVWTTRVSAGGSTMPPPGPRTRWIHVGPEVMGSIRPRGVREDSPPHQRPSASVFGIPLSRT